MKIRYVYDSPGECKTIKVFDSIDSFTEDISGKMFKQLLSDRMVKITDKITIETSYPAIITIEILYKER